MDSISCCRRRRDHSPVLVCYCCLELQKNVQEMCREKGAKTACIRRYVNGGQRRASLWVFPTNYVDRNQRNDDLEVKATIALPF